MTTQSHIQTTFKNASIFFAATVFEKAVGFVMLPFYANFLRSEGYGTLAMLELITSAMSALVGYGIGSAVYRFYFDKDTEADKQVLVSTAIIVLFLMTSLISLPSLAMSGHIAYWSLGTSDLQLYVFLAIVAFLADATSFGGQEYLLIQQRSIFVSIVSVSRCILGLILNIYFIVFLRLGVLGVLYSHAITAVAFTIYYNSYTLSKVGIRFNRADAKAILGFSLPLIPGYVATFIRHNADRVVLKAFMGLSQLGVYSMVISFSALIGLLVHDPFMKTWAPKRMEICNTENGAETITRTVTFHIAMMLFAGLILALEIPLLLKLLTPSEFWVPALIACVAVFSRIIFNVYYHVMFGLLYGQKTFKLSVIQIMTALISIILNVVLIRFWGLFGAFLAVLLVNLFQCIITYYMAQPHYKVMYEWRKIVIMTTSAIALFGLINMVNIQALGFDNVVDRIIFYISHGSLDSEWKLKVLGLLQEKALYILEGLLKGVLSLIFIFILTRSDIIPRGSIARIAARIVPSRIAHFLPKGKKMHSDCVETLITHSVSIK